MRPLTEVQTHRQVALKSYDEFDLTQLVGATTTNLDALENYFSSNPFLTDPDVSQGLSTLFSDLATGTSNPVTNPISLLTEGALALLSPGYGIGAASSALTGVSDNVQAALSSGDYSTALTDLENGPTTVLYAALNGYPDAVGNGLTSPEFGLLTSPDGSDLATGSVYAIDQLENTVAAELSAVGGGDLTSTASLLGPGSLDLGINIDALLNDLAPGGTLTLPFSIDSILGDLAPSGTLNLPFSIDSILGDLAPSGDITLPFSLNDVLGDVAPGGGITLPISLDTLLGDFATNGDITVPITPDQLLGEILGSGNLSVSLPEETILSTVFPNGLNVGFTTVSLSTIESLLKLSSSSTINVSIPDSTVLSTIESVLGNTGNTDISVPLSSLETLLPGGGTDITVSLSELESLFGSSGSNDITLSVADLESLLGSTGSSDLSVPISSLETLLGTFGSNDISIPISTLESLLPSTLSLALPIPDVTGTFPTFDVDLSHDLLSVLGSIAPISSDLPTLLTPDPTLDLIPLLTSVVGDLGLPIDIIGGDLPANLTGIVADVLAGLVP